jgi:hypothetical protein
MTDSQELYQRIAQRLAALPGVAQGQMFGMPVVKVNGKAFTGYYQGDMAFKLSGPAHAEALALSGAALFDPSGRGRPMREWVRVPAAQAAAWVDLAYAALQYVSSLVAKA